MWNKLYIAKYTERVYLFSMSKKHCEVNSEKFLMDSFPKDK